MTYGTRGYQSDPIIQSLNYAGRSIGGALAQEGTNALNAERQKMELQDRQLAMPAKELAAAEAQDQLDRRSQGVRLLDFFPDDRSLELGIWQPKSDEEYDEAYKDQMASGAVGPSGPKGYGGHKRPSKDRKVAAGEPTLIQKVGDMFDAKIDTNRGSENYGFFIKSDGSRLTQAEVNMRAPEVEALFAANMGVGRTIRMGIETAEDAIIEIDNAVRAGEMDPAQGEAQIKEHQAVIDDLRQKANDPLAKIQTMEQTKAFLQNFKGKEIEKGIARLDKSIANQQKILEAHEARKLKREDMKGREDIAIMNANKDLEIARMKIKADRDIANIKISADNFDNMHPEAKLAYWYAQEVNKAKEKGADDISPAKAWESIQAQKSFKAAMEAYNNFIENNWTPDADEMKKVEKRAAELFLDRVKPQSEGAKKDWRQYQTAPVAP